MFTWLSQWFHATSVSHSYNPKHYVILSAIIGVGIWLRFWGLGNVGLHGDEETMAMPTLALLESGAPLLPSGMFYPRALAQIYMMAGSVMIFGDSEWALRFPSAVIGSLGLIVAFFLGKRFLPPELNLTFVAIIALLPDFIEISQTARMYVFWMTSLMLFGTLLFRWERDGSNRSLGLALLAWLIALHFHQLSIFAVFLFLFPGLISVSWRKLSAGTFAAVLGAGTFLAYQNWISDKYPQSDDRAIEIAVESSSAISPIRVILNDHLLVIVVSLVVWLAIILIGLKVAKHSLRAQIAGILLLAAAYISAIFLQYHIAVVLLGVGTITLMRLPDKNRNWLLAVLVAFAVVMAVQCIILSQTGDYPGRKLIGALVGLPSIWPTIRFSEYSPIGSGIYASIVMVAVVHLAKRQSIPDHFLFFIVAVWAQLFAVGFFRWYIPPRYVMGALPFFLLCYVAGFYYLMGKSPRLGEVMRRPSAKILIPVFMVALAVNPMALARTVNSGYELHPDHKGAAEYLLNLSMDESTILIAEDVLQQTYYMGKVDYWLVNKEVGRVYSVVIDGVLHDQYTHAITIGTGDELETILDNNTDREIYIIGSGENFSDQRQYMRGHGISDVLNSDRVESVFLGRDKKTRVWRVRR
jgi:uncharacterized membrane protein